MKVIKFGGGVLHTPDDFKKTELIIKRFPGQKLIIVVSAFNNITNRFENLLNTYRKTGVIDIGQLNSLKSFHLRFARKMPSIEQNVAKNSIEIIFNNVKRDLLQSGSETYLRDYDRIVSAGELLSSSLLFLCMKSKKFKCELINATEIIKTDSAYTEASVNWEETSKLVKAKCDHSQSDIIVTQGFIGSDHEGNTTTLGREGSDFSAAVLAYTSDADEVIFWKEVDGIYNADPKLTENHELIPELSYKESVEQAFYGAKILHPKTIKPLQNKKIPIHVRSFYNPETPGTCISERSDGNLHYPPIYIVKENQILISVFTLDFSFVSEENLGLIFNLLTKYRLKVNMMQTSAISFSICLTNNEFKIPQLMEDLKAGFKVRYNDGLKMITIRHYTDAAIQQMVEGKMVLLQQNSRDTIQFVVRND
jgi:aspartate kinase